MLWGFLVQEVNTAVGLRKSLLFATRFTPFLPGGGYPLLYVY